MNAKLVSASILIVATTIGCLMITTSAATGTGGSQSDFSSLSSTAEAGPAHLDKEFHRITDEMVGNAGHVLLQGGEGQGGGRKRREVSCNLCGGYSNYGCALACKADGYNAYGCSICYCRCALLV